MKCPKCKSSAVVCLLVRPKREHYLCNNCGEGFYVPVYPPRAKGIGGPYFIGQTPADKKGHYFPDVIRVADFKVRSNVYVRLSHCIICGYEVEEIKSREAMSRSGFAAWRAQKRRELCQNKGRTT